MLGRNWEVSCPNCVEPLDRCACSCPFCGETIQCRCCIGSNVATGG